MEEILPNNLLLQLFDEVPEYKVFYDRLATREEEIARGIHQPERIFYWLAYFMILAHSKDEDPKLDGPTFTDLHDLLERTMSFVERATHSSDEQIQQAINTGLLPIISIMHNSFPVIVKNAGPNTKQRLLDLGVRKKFMYLFDK